MQDANFFYALPPSFYLPFVFFVRVLDKEKKIWHFFIQLQRRAALGIDGSGH